MAPFLFPKGRKVFNGAITYNLSFSYFSSTRAISPKDVNVKAEHAPSSAKKKEKTGRSSKDVPKGMQSTTKLQKPFLREHSISFLLKSRSKGNAELTAKSQR
jgi:hypothetical protein